MNQLSSFVRFAGCTGLALALASACGGKSFVGDEGGEAGSSSGGTTSSQAGSSHTAGKGHAGTSAGGAVGTSGTGSGGTVGVAGAAGAAGSYAGAGCTAPPHVGNCDGLFPAWYHDPSTGICRPFQYGGCGGNENRYASLADCQKACSAGTPNYDSCKLPSDCVVTGTGCCGICDSPDITAHDLIAYNEQYGNLLQCNIAFDRAPPSGGASSAGASAPIACAPCAPLPGGPGALDYFVPDCVRGQCVVTDLRTSPVTACKVSEECRVRQGLGCCEGCGGRLIAVRSDGSFEKLVCSGPAGPCPLCGQAPPDAIAYCSPEGRCELGFPLEAQDGG